MIAFGVRFMEKVVETEGCRRCLGKFSTLSRLGPIVMGVALAMGSADGQTTGTGTATGTTTSGGGGSSNGTQQASGPAAVQSAQQTLNGLNGGSGTQTNGQPSNANDYKGSVVNGTATAGVLDLSIDDAIQRGLRNNLGLILQGSNVQNASGVRLQQLQGLLPTITGNASYEAEQVNLAAFGLRIPGLNPIVGPFQVVDFRAYLTWSLFNLSSIDKYLAAKHNFQGSRLTAEDARNMVVLTVGNAYLLCIADASRITAEEAELANAKVSLDQATAAHDAGTSPKLDVLRAQVDYQNAQQQLVQARNGFEKDKLALARAIGLPVEQQFRLTDPVPYAEAAALTPEQAFQQALSTRKDLQGMAEQVKAGEKQRASAVAEQYPTVNFNGDYGDLGNTLGHTHGTFTATGEVSVPILQIAKTRGDIRVADAALEQQRARYSDQVQQVNQDVRDAILDIEAAQKLVQTARSNVDLSNEALSEAQQRFRSGVSDNLAVSQAQAQTQQANDQYISALYQHNMAKLSLARATGTAGTNYKNAFQAGGH